VRDELQRVVDASIAVDRDTSWGDYGEPQRELHNALVAAGLIEEDEVDDDE
jgi:hypothetical protein